MAIRLRGLAFVPVVGVAIHDQIVAVKRVETASMVPTLEDREWVLVDRGFGNRNWRRNDVVIARSPADRRRTLCSRLRHFQGEYVRVRTPSGFYKLIVVPRGHCWMQCDSDDDDDSRSFGPLPYALIEGKVCAVLWPPDRVRWVS